MVSRVRDAGHLSTFEHTMFTFGVSGVSRALTHQLVRHRHMSYEQKSQRYIKVKGQFDFITPPSMTGRPEIVAKYEALMAQISEFYAEALAAGVPSRRRALRASERRRNADRHHRERARAARLLHATFVQQRAVGNPRARVRDVASLEAGGAVAIRARRCNVRARLLQRAERPRMPAVRRRSQPGRGAPARRVDRRRSGTREPGYRRRSTDGGARRLTPSASSCACCSPR